MTDSPQRLPGPEGAAEQIIAELTGRDTFHPVGQGHQA
jgi:hypothetical protein